MAMGKIRQTQGKQGNKVTTQVVILNEVKNPGRQGEILRKNGSE
jgi:hypothetical protein